MRIKGFSIGSTAGLELVEVDQLSDVIVLAGPNGVGKTRIITTLISFFRKPAVSQNVRLVIEATNDLERKDWGKPILDTTVEGDAELLRARLRKNQRRSRYTSTVLNFESDRTIAKIAPFTFSWDFADPLDEEVGWDSSFGYLRDRFTDVQHSLFRLVEVQRRKIAEKAIELRDAGEASMALDFEDPIEPYRAAFRQLLGPKELLEVDVKAQQISYSLDGESRDLATLSSGEREVVNIVFDFLLRQPSDCIVFFDEPELHLHPELSYRLLQTLSAIGKNNQFLFCTHSPEIITASIENSVVFVTPPNGPEQNQAVVVSRDDATHHALNLLGQSIGVISLGRKLLLIEGEESSLDKQTYGAILKNEFPELVLVPVGGKSPIRAFDEVYESVIGKTIWGVEFFMLCDRDAQYAIGLQALQKRLSDRLQLLPRYHLENYFLDENVLAAIFRDMEAPGSWLRDPGAIADSLRVSAKGMIPYAVALKTAAHVRELVGNVDIMPKNIGTSLGTLLDAFRVRIPQESGRVTTGLDQAKIEALAAEEFDRLSTLVADGSSDWKVDVPGKVLLKKFAAASSLPVGRLKTLYLRHASEAASDPFYDIRELFRAFRDFSRASQTTSTAPIGVVESGEVPTIAAG
jgi:ABC-type cobalamin/Fe3+-siderophores transport system ATPase subunit